MIPSAVITNDVVIISGEKSRTKALFLSYTLYFEVVGLLANFRSDSH